MYFVKVKSSNYQERRFTVKPTEQVKNIHEINIEDYLANLKTALNQTYKPMNIMFTNEKTTKRTLSDFTSY